MTETARYTDVEGPLRRLRGVQGVLMHLSCSDHMEEDACALLLLESDIEDAVDAIEAAFEGKEGVA